MGRFNTSATLCWKCTKACNGGCSWSADLQPVPGWTARWEPNNSGTDSYMVIDCPEFELETPANKNRELNTAGCVALVEKLLKITREDYILGNNAMQQQIDRFLRGTGAGRLHGLENPEAVIRMLKKAAEEHRKKKAMQSMVKG